MRPRRDDAAKTLVPVSDAAGRRVAAYARIDPRSDGIRAYPWYRLTADGEALTFAHPLSGGRPTTMARVVLGLVDREDWDPEHEAWIAYGYSGGRYVNLGRFDDELAAARAARAWADDNQSVHLEDDFRAGGFGRGSRAPTSGSEAQRKKTPIGGKE